MIRMDKSPLSKVTIVADPKNRKLVWDVNGVEYELKCLIVIKLGLNGLIRVDLMTLLR